MPKAIIEQKAKLTNEFVEEIKKAKSFLVFEYLGLTVKELVSIRKKLHDNGAYIKIVKNNILNRALKAINLNPIECVGPNAIIIHNDDEICGFKSVANLIDKKRSIKFKFGYLDNKLVETTQLTQIAAIPGRKDLYSMILFCLTSGVRNFLYCLNAIYQKQSSKNNQ